MRRKEGKNQMATETLFEVMIPTSKPLAGKVALVTGASRGIGRAIALELANRGATIAISYRTGLSGAEVVRSEIEQLGSSSEIFQGDISEKLQARAVVRQVLETYERIDILVNIAGITRDRSIRKMTDDDWTDVIDTNLNSAFYCTSAAIPTMIEQKFGRIVSVASFVGQAGNFGQANYAASKAGLIGFAKSIAQEVASRNVTVNVVASLTRAGLGFSLRHVLPPHSS